MIRKLMTWICTGSLLLATTDITAYTSGIKNLGMGGAGVANPQDSLAGVYNPAGMVFVGNRIDLGAIALKDNGYAKIFNSDVSGQNGTFRSDHGNGIVGPDLAFNNMLCCSKDVAVGMMLYNRNYIKTNYEQPFPLFGTTDLGLEIIQECISPVIALSYRCWAFGVTFNVIGQRVSVTGLENLAAGITIPGGVATISANPYEMTNEGYNYSTGVGTTLGLMWTPLTCLRFGLVWEPRTYMTRMKHYSGFLADGGKLDLPQTISGGILWMVNKCTNVTADLQWIQWSRINALGQRPPEGNTFDEIVTNLINRPFGSRNGPGFGWQDQAIIRAGIDYIFSEAFTVRAGYRYANSPVRQQDTSINVLTLETIQNYATIGFTYRHNYGWEISGFYAYGTRHTVHGTKIFELDGSTADDSNNRHAGGVSLGIFY